MRWIHIAALVVSVGAQPMDEFPEPKRGDRPQPKKATKLHELITVSPNGEFEMDEVSDLVKAGADLNERDDSGHTMLMVAALMDQQELAKHMLELGADPLVTDPQGSTAVHMAASLGRDQILEQFVDAAGKPVLGATNLMGSTPLHFAAKSGQVSTVYKLIALGADVGARDRAGATPEDDAKAAAAQRPGQDQAIQMAIRALRDGPLEVARTQKAATERQRRKRKKKRKREAKEEV